MENSENTAMKMANSTNDIVINISGFSNDTYDTNLQHVNDMLVLKLWPAIVYTFLLMLIGTPGNGVVLYIYYFKWKKSSSRMFILFLAVLDMLNCVTTLPIEIIIMRYTVVFDIPWICKISRFSTFFLNTASAAILVAIATDRFKRICRPWSNQFSASVSRNICIGCILVACVLTWPVLVFYGTRYVVIGNAVGTACLVENSFDESSYPHIYFVFMMSLTILVFGSLSTLYYFVGLQIYKHKLFKQKRYDKGKGKGKGKVKSSLGKINENIEPINGYSDQNVTDEKIETDKFELDSGKISTCMCECPKDNTNEIEVVDTLTTLEAGKANSHEISTTDGNIISSTEPCNCKCVNFRLRIGKSTLMLFLITLAYIISFLPYYTLAIIRQSNEELFTQLSDTAYMAYHVFLRSYQLSSAINPIIYCFCNAQFRSFALDMFRRKHQNSI